MNTLSFVYGVLLACVAEHVPFISLWYIPGIPERLVELCLVFGPGQGEGAGYLAIDPFGGLGRAT